MKAASKTLESFGNVYNILLRASKDETSTFADSI